MLRVPHVHRGLALLALLLLAAGDVSAARSNWRFMSVGQFQVYSTLNDTRTRAVARELQAFSQTVGEMLKASDRLPDIPTRVYLVSHSDFTDFMADHRDTAGRFRDLPGQNLVVIDAGEDFNVVKRVIFSEYTNGILRDSRALILPYWYHTGYSELFSSFRMQGNDAYVGELPARMTVSIEPRTWIPLERLLAVQSGNDVVFKDSISAQQYRGEAWALVHLLLFDTTELARPTSDYLSAMNLSVSEPEAFAHSFPFDKAALDLKLRQLIHGKVMHIRKLMYSSPVSIEAVTLKPLTPLEADIELARVAFLRARPQNLVDSLVEALVREAPQDPGVRALAARVAARAKAPFDITDLTAKLADGGTTDEQARIDAADALISADTSKATGKQALAILDGVVRGDAPSIDAVRYWSYAGQLADIDPARRLAVLEPASARAPHDTWLLRNLATASEALGRTKAARAYYARIMEVSRNADERLWAQKQVDSARLSAEQKVVK